MRAAADTIGVAQTLLPDELTRSARRSLLATLEGVGTPSESAPGVALRPGAIVNGRYTIERVIGAGGMGIVYRVADALHPDRPLALKTLRGGASRRAALSLFKSEFRTMTELRHPHLAQVYDFEPIRGSEQHLFTMDFVDGADAMRATEGAGHRTVVEVLVQACRALSYVHSRDVVHFDLKPDNVLVTRDGTVKIVDFGIAGSALAERDAIRGTPHYMAPELTGDAGLVDHRADLYALGIMTFELTFRRLPFVGSSFVELMRLHHLAPIEPTEAEAASVPPWLLALVRRLAAKHPDERFHTANEVIEEINRAGGATYALETKETQASYALAGRFVGREAERDALWSFVRARSEGARDAPAAAVIGGQSGVGKSRLARELRRLCQLSRIPFVEVVCHEHGADLAPIARALSFALTLAETLGRADLVERFGPQLAKILPSLAGRVATAGVHPDPVRERASVREAAADFLLALGEAAPYVLYVDDLQWAGEAAAAVVRHVVYGGAEGRRSRLALVGGYRDDELEGAPIAALLEDARDRLCAVSLTPLGEVEVEALIRSMLGVDALPAPFVELVARSTGGSPFFVEEVMRSLLEHGHVVREAGRWSARARLSDLPIPERMDDVLVRRAERLPPLARGLLEIVSVHGKPLESDALREASGLDEAAFFEALGLLRHRSMIRLAAGDPPAFGPAHDRVREKVAEALEGGRRRALHLRLAEALDDETTAGEASFDAANHYAAAVEATDPPATRRRAAAALARAAAEASRAALHEAARGYLERALALLDGIEEAEPERASLRPRLLEMLYVIDRGEAERRLPEMLRVATESEQATLHSTKCYALMSAEPVAAYEHAIDATAGLGLRLPKHPGPLRTLVDYLALRWAIRGLDPTTVLSWPEASDPRFRAACEVLAVAGSTASFVGKAAMISIVSHGLRAMRRRGVVPDATSVLIGLSMALQATGELARGYGFARAGVEIAARAGYPGQTAVEGAWGGVFAGVWSAPLPEVLRDVERACAAGRDRVHSGLLALAANVWITSSVFLAKSADEWRALVARHQPLLLSVGDPHARGEVRGIERAILALRGESVSALALDDPSETDEQFRAGLVGDPLALAHAASFAARRAAIDGEWERAEREAAAARRAARESPLRQLFLAQAELLHYLARTQTGSWRRARLSQWWLRRGYARYARACPSTFAHGLALMDAQDARLAGRVREAAAAYARAIDGAREGGFRLDEALACQLAARFWAAQGAPAEAAAHTARAADVYEAWGATRVAADLRRAR